MSTRLRIALVASARHPIREPYAGGLEAHVSSLARGLTLRGHNVALYAAPDSQAMPQVTLHALQRPLLSVAARSDSSMPPENQMNDHYAYLRLMLELASQPRSYDMIHNHSLHYLPVAMAEASKVPIVTTLHTPPTPWLECAIQAGAHGSVRYVAVSGHTAAAWRHVVPDTAVVPNGIDLCRFRLGPGAGPPIWFGRITPEKGPHLAVQAALVAGKPLDLAGPITDHDYFAAHVQPLLDDRRRYLGHLNQTALADAVGLASCALVTPVWEEPYGLVVVEALACGTPVCGFARGALPELVDASCGELVAPDDVSELASAIGRAERLSRADARRRATSHASIEVMLDRYEQIYEETLVN